jgi:hypothetical protein
MLQSSFLKNLGASLADVLCLLALAAPVSADWTQVPQRKTSNPATASAPTQPAAVRSGATAFEVSAQSGPELRAPGQQPSQTNPAARRRDEIPVPPPPAPSNGVNGGRERSPSATQPSQVLPPPPPPSPNQLRPVPDRSRSPYATTPQRSAPAPSGYDAPPRSYPAPAYSGGTYTVPGRRFSLRLPGISVDVGRGNRIVQQQYTQYGPQYAPQHAGGFAPVNYSSLYGQTEQLAKRLRDIHVYLHRQGQIEYYQPSMNTSREQLEAMKELARKQFPIERIQAQFAAFDDYWHPMEQQLNEAAAYDPTLRQLVAVVADLEDQMHRALDMGYVR